MLGRQHLTISMSTVLPFFIPLFFTDLAGTLMLSGIIFLAVISAGSLIPDADCGGKSKLYYDMPYIYQMMIPIQWVVTKTFQLLYRKTDMKLEYVSDNEHRGIMHAPVGILFTSILFVLIALLIMVFLKNISIVLLFVIFFGLFLGQILHILEDSCTRSGINWKYPFGTKEIKGRIYTFGKIEGSKDIRPGVFNGILTGISVLVAAHYMFLNSPLPVWLIYLLIFTAVILTWALILYFARTDWSFWYVGVDTMKKVKSAKRNLINNLSDFADTSDFFDSEPKKRRRKKK